MIIFSSQRWLVALLFLTFGVGLGGCSTLSGWFGDDAAAVESTANPVVLWQSGDYFIRIEPQDRTAGTPRPNQHPATINRDRIRHALKLVRFRQSSNDDWTNLFTKENLTFLGAYIEQGLAKASPTQDVTFAMESWHRFLFGIRSDIVITGRVFYANGQLNLIFGRIGPTNKKSDSKAELSARNKDIRLFPYVPGLRGVEVASGISFSAPPGSGVFRPAGTKRSDWLIFSNKALSLGSPSRSTSPRSTSRGDARSTSHGDSRAEAESGVPSSQLEDLRREVERLKNRIGNDESNDDQQRRLRVIKNLREKGLISQEEFERKRQEIISAL